MGFSVQSVRPEWGVNYDAGYPGFQFTDNSFISRGICWFSRWDAWPLPILVSHTFITTSPDLCVEADSKGVVSATLQERFNDPHTHVFFRKPQDYDAEMASQIITEAVSHIGEKYGYGLIVAKFLARTIPGRALDAVTRGWFNESLCRMLDRHGTADCDKIVAMALNAATKLTGRGVLQRAAREQTPESIFEDQVLFCPWNNQSVSGK